MSDANTFAIINRTLILVACFAMSDAVSHAAPPTVTALFPSGMQRGTTTEVTASGTFDSWPVSVWTDRSGLTFVAGKDKGKFTVSASADLSPGIHWIRFYDPSGASGLRPFLVGTLREINETEPNDDAAKAPLVDVPVIVNGKLAKNGDVDCYSVTLQKGQTLVASLVAHETLRSPMDCILQLVTPTGTVLAENHDHRGLDPQLVYTATRAGTYVVRQFAFPSTPDSSIRFFGSDLCVYRLTLSTGPFVDFATPWALEWGREGTLALAGWNLPESTVHVSGFQEFISRPWLHDEIAFRREPHTCFDAVAQPLSTPLSSPCSVTGVVAKDGANALIPLACKKGQSLHMTLEAGKRGSPLEPVVRILDGTKKQLAKADPAALHGDCELTFTPSADGTYTIEVRDLYRHGSPRHVFLARIVPLEPTYSPTISSDRISITIGTPLDIPVTLNRKNGWAKPLHWFAEGLPNGVTCREIVKAGAVDPNTITLRFDATTAGVSGRIRVASETIASPTAIRPVKAVLAEFDMTTSDLWLTVVPPQPKPRQ